MSSEDAAPQQEHTVIEQLEAERVRLENALRHLDASNVELREALARDGPDPDYEDALRENVDVMSGMLAKVAELQREIDALRGPSTTAAEAPTAQAEGGQWL